VGPTQMLVEAFLALFLEPVDPLMGGLPADAIAFGQVGDGVVVEPVVFEKPLSLFAHGNTFPGHRRYLLWGKCHLCP